MKLRVLGHTAGACRGFPSTAALVDDDILLDAGTGASALYGAEMARVSDLLLTHSHLDHVAMMCFVADYRQKEGLTAHCLPETAEAVRSGILNGAIWPRMDQIKVEGRPLISFNDIAPFQRFEIRGRFFTALPAHHTTPTVGFCLHGERENFVWFSDICGADPEVWEWMNNLENFNRVVMEASFPEEDDDLARVSGHLTPESLESLLKNLRGDLRVYCGHVKPREANVVAAQLRSRFGDRATLLEAGQVFEI